MGDWSLPDTGGVRKKWIVAFLGVYKYFWRRWVDVATRVGDLASFSF